MTVFRPSDDQYWVPNWSSILFAGDLFAAIPFLDQPTVTVVEESRRGQDRQRLGQLDGRHVQDCRLAPVGRAPHRAERIVAQVSAGGNPAREVLLVATVVPSVPGTTERHAQGTSAARTFDDEAKVRPCRVNPCESVPLQLADENLVALAAHIALNDQQSALVTAPNEGNGIGCPAPATHHLLVPVA